MPWLADQVHPEDRQAFQRGYEEFVAGRAERYELELRVRHKQGHWVWVQGLARALERNADGSVRRLVGIMLDVSVAKEAQNVLRRREELFRAITDDLPLIVWLHDREGRQEFVNQTFCEYFGVTREELGEDRWRGLTHADDAEYTEEFLACVRQQRSFHGFVRVRRADGQWRWLESWSRPRFSSTGKYLGHIGTSAVDCL